MPEHPALSTSQAAHVVRCSQQTIIRWCNQGVLRCTRVGNGCGRGGPARRIERSDLERTIRHFDGLKHLHDRDRDAMLARLCTDIETPKREKFLSRLQRLRIRQAFTTGDVAFLLRCCPATIQNMCDDGRLRSYRIGADRRVTREALEEYVRVHGAPNMELGWAASVEAPR